MRNPFLLYLDQSEIRKGNNVECLFLRIATFKIIMYKSQARKITFSCILQAAHHQTLVDMPFALMRPFLPYYALVETYEFYHLHLYKPSYPQITLVHNEVPKTHQGFHADLKLIANVRIKRELCISTNLYLCSWMHLKWYQGTNLWILPSLFWRPFYC